VLNGLLFSLDNSTLEAKLDVAGQALITAEAEHRQQAQIAVFDAKSKARLADFKAPSKSAAPITQPRLRRLERLHRT
jgi:multidrug resistance efflux pump